MSRTPQVRPGAGWQRRAAEGLGGPGPTVLTVCGLAAGVLALVVSLAVPSVSGAAPAGGAAAGAGPSSAASAASRIAVARSTPEKTARASVPTTSDASAGRRWPSIHRGDSYGIDVSSYQGQIDWSAVVAQGVRFVYVKATQGTTYVDPYFTADWQGAKAAGLAYGAYQFFSLCSSGLAQADRFLATVPRDTAALPVAVDLELHGNCAARPKASKMARQLDAFVKAVQRATRKPVIFYVGLDFGLWYDKLPLFDRHPLWLDLVAPPVGKTVVIWQWDSPVRVKGITGAVDLDVAHMASLDAAHR